MPDKKLQPVRPERSLETEIEEKIKKIFRDLFYGPLLEELDAPKKLLKNSSDPLKEAISSGRIYFYRGEFKGRFGSRIAKALRSLGARYDRKNKSYRLLAADLPKDLRSEIKASQAVFEKTITRMQMKIDSISPDGIVDQLDVTNLFDRQIFKVDGDIEKQLKNIMVFQKLTKQQRQNIAKQYTNNMKLYVKGWLEDEIVTLRKKMKKNVEIGIRYEEMVDDISERFNVSETKARFLARQETSLLNVELQRERYQDAGFNEYYWQNVTGTAESPVRQSHKVLDGMLCKWSDPTVYSDDDGKTWKKRSTIGGVEKHAGQDFNCRCRARARIKF